MGGLLANLDQKKAFKSVNSHYSEVMLVIAGLGNDHRGWISDMYSDIKSRVQVDGYMSQPFNMKRSVLQGCLSPLLHVLAFETLL